MVRSGATPTHLRSDMSEHGPPARSLLRATGAYVAALTLARGVSLVAVPLVTWAVSTEELGEFAVLNSVVLLSFAIMVDLGLDTAGIRLASEESGKRRRSVFSTLLGFRMLLAGAVAGLLVLFRQPVAELALGADEHADLIPWLAFTLVLGSPARAVSNWLRVEGRHMPVALAMGVVGALEGGLFIVLVYGLRWGLEGLVVGRVAAQAIALLPLLWIGREVLLTRPSRRWIAPLFRIGVPFAALYALTGLRELDRFLVAELGSLSAAGVYDLAVRVAAPLGMLNLALMMTLEPALHARRADENLGRDVDTFLQAYIWLGGSVSFVVAVFGPELAGLVSESYRAAVLVVPAMLFLEVLEGARRIAGVGGELAQRTGLWIATAAVNASLTIGLSLWLIPRFPLLGAPTALVVGAAAGTLVANRLAEGVRQLELRVARGVLVCVIGATAATYLVSLDRHGAASLVARVAAALMAPLLGAALLGVTWSKLRATVAAVRARAGGAP